METELLRKILLALFFLVILLGVLGIFTSVSKTATTSARCRASIVEMYGYNAPLEQGEGITCTTDSRVVKGSTEQAVAKQLANEGIRCTDQFGNFAYDPFHTTQLDTLCLVC